MKTLIIGICACFALSCNNATPVAQNGNSAPAATPERSQTAIAHGPDERLPTPNSNSKWKQSGDPIETKDLDAAIVSAEVAFKKKADDPAAKKNLAEAYYKRAVALTEARQYASALGDYRRTIKHDPTNADAKKWIDQIIQIYQSMGRDSPPEGEEPPPLTLEKGKTKS